MQHRLIPRQQDIARRFWNANSRTWDDLLNDDDATKHIDDITTALADLLATATTIVDLGCGTGNYATRLAQRGHSVRD